MKLFGEPEALNVVHLHIRWVTDPRVSKVQVRVPTTDALAANQIVRVIGLPRADPCILRGWYFPFSGDRASEPVSLLSEQKARDGRFHVTDAVLRRQPLVVDGAERHRLDEQLDAVAHSASDCERQSALGPLRRSLVLQTRFDLEAASRQNPGRLRFERLRSAAGCRQRGSPYQERSYQCSAQFHDATSFPRWNAACRRGPAVPGDGVRLLVVGQWPKDGDPRSSS